MTENNIQPTTELQNDKPRPSFTRWILAGCGVFVCLFAAGALGLLILFPAGRDIAKRFVATPSAHITEPDIRSGVTVKDNTMGDPNAPVRIIEYGDFQCPYCLRFWQLTEPKIIETYVKTGKVFFEYRSMGAFIGPESAAAAEAAYCAADQGKFWEYHDTLFSNWTGENVGDFSDEHLHQFARLVGLNETTFDQCLILGLNKARVERDVESARSNKVRVTPTFLINGKMVEGAQPFEIMQREIEAALDHRLPDAQQGSILQTLFYIPA